jgi:exonuclease SbcC
MSHSHSELNFDFSSALVIGEYEGDQYMSNGTGKSSIFEALTWALFGKARCKYSDSIVKDGKVSCKVTLLFMHDDKKYKIVRIRNAKYASQSSLEFFEILSDDSEAQIKADTNTELAKKICEVIHSNYEVFVNSVYFKQGDVSGFLNGKASDRQKIASSILNLDRWNRHKDTADKRYKEIDKQLSLLKYKLSELSDIDDLMLDYEEKLDTQTTIIEDLTPEEEVLQEEIRALELKVSNIKMQDSNLSDYQHTQTKFEYAQNKITELGGSLEKKAKLVQSSEHDIQKNEEAIEHAEAKILELVPSLSLKDKLNIPDFERKLMKGKVRYDMLSSQIVNQEKNEECEACGTIWEDKRKKRKEIAKKKIELEELKAKIDKAETKLDAKKAKGKEIAQIEVEIDKYSTRCKSFDNSNELHRLRIDSSQNEITLLKQNLAEASKEKDSLEKALSGMQVVFENSDFNSIVETLELKQERRKEIVRQREDAIHELGGIKYKLEGLYKSREAKFALGKEIGILNREATIYSSLVRSFGRNGIQAIMVDNVMEELARVTNEQLNEFTAVPTYVDFITQKQDTKGSWKETLEIDVRTPAGIREFDGLSGGEAFRVAFAIRLALSSIQARRMGGETQLLMLDEVSTNLDRHGLEAFVSIIRRLEKDLKILVITHDDKFKEEFEHIITVKKNGDDSTIYQD